MQIATGAVLIACGLMLPLLPAPGSGRRGLATADRAHARRRDREPHQGCSGGCGCRGRGSGEAVRRSAGSRVAEPPGASPPAGRASASPPGPRRRNARWRATVRRARSREPGRTSPHPTTGCCPLAVIAAAICLFASELMTVFDFTPPGAEPLCTQGGARPARQRADGARRVRGRRARDRRVRGLEAGRDRGRGLRRGGPADLPDRRPAGRQRAGVAERGLRRARRLVHRRQGGAAGRVLPRAGRLAGAHSHRDRAGDDDPRAAAGAAAAEARAADRAAAHGTARGRRRRPAPRTRPPPARTRAASAASPAAPGPVSAASARAARYGDYQR